MTRIQANLVLLLAAAIWGGGFVAQSTAMASIGPFWFVGLRFAIAALAVLPFAMMESRRMESRPSFAETKTFMLVGVALFLGAITQQIGLLTTTVTNSSFLTALYVIFVPVIAVVVYRRNPHWIVWPGALMMLCGIFLLSGGGMTRLTTGDTLSIICAVFWAIQITLAGRFVMQSNRPLALSCTQFAVCAILSMVIGIFIEPINYAAVEASIREILYVGLVSSGLAFVLQVIGQRYTTAPQAAIFLSSEALFGALFATIFLNETIPAIGYIGCAIIFVAILLVELVPEVFKRRDNRVVAET
ncbi:drug/metabolite transporter (DMT)-like permease [Rhizobium skierniewicense]|uniref:Drug/metabolite transporter (DMT)-like permease n=1 Tax=Rhizobium skierniewicense TaxID=984260 RepID=A0A7W6CEA9_9HYPH|nr:DMT family transporter [Rhizobium skierniewicense]MBB3945646.1 drug/metabolite transporter (DMT)-like permease [Rhizobium skierniewicense]